MDNAEKREMLIKWDTELAMRQFMTSDPAELDKIRKRQEMLFEYALMLKLEGRLEESEAAEQEGSR